jgi:lactate permease
MADSSMAQGIADGVRRALGSLAVIVTPLLAGALGFLTGSSNATNGLLMRSQVSLADGHVALVWIAALQNTAAAALTMLSPVRVAMGCALVGQSDLQRTVYTQAWPLGAAALGVFACVAAFLLSLSWL